MATRTVECPICQEDISDPRLLPCTHSFCLECLETYCRDKLPGDDMPCPVCRNEFQIPKNGVACLPVRTHTKLKLTHSSSAELDREHYCEKHKDDRIKIGLYCFDCDMNVCAMCCLEHHKTHKFERIETVVEQFSRSIDDEIKQVTSRIECFRGVAAQLEAESIKTLDNIKAIELELKNRSREIKELVDRQESDLLQELQSLKSAAEKGVKLHRDTLQLAMTVMDNFRTSSLELRSKGSPSDITQAANDVHDRAKKLLQTWVIPGEYHAPSYTFTPADIDELLRDNQNLIGHVVKVEDSAARVVKTIKTGSSVLGVTSVDDQLFALLERDNNQVAVYSINDYQLLQRYINLLGLKPHDRNDMTSCVRHKCLYMSDHDNRCIHRYDISGTFSAAIKRLGGRRISKWSVPGKPCGLSVTRSCNLLVTCRVPNILVELSADSGQCVREIALQSDIVNPRHGVTCDGPLTTGQFVVCHGLQGDNRVCEVGDDGKVTRSYGGQCGSDVGQLDCPCHLAVDKDSQFIFVGDLYNDRVVLLSPTLEFVRYVIEEMSEPHRLYLHQATRRLFVGRRGDVTVIQL